MSDLIRVEHLAKTYLLGEMRVPALRGVDLSIQAGEYVAVMGASGSGKSTFMNIVGCLDVPTKGEYLLDKVNIGKLNKDQLAQVRNNKIGFVFQSFNLLSRTTALENVELPLMYNSRIATREMRDKAMRALESVGLSDRSHHLPNQLSGGEQQRVAIARALVNDPVVILADEPTGNLDTRTSVEVMDIFQQLNKKGITVVIVTHEPDIASYTNRNITFKDGKVQKDIPVTKPKIASEELLTLPVLTEEETL